MWLDAWQLGSHEMKTKNWKILSISSFYDKAIKYTQRASVRINAMVRNMYARVDLNEYLIEFFGVCGFILMLSMIYRFDKTSIVVFNTSHSICFYKLKIKPFRHGSNNFFYKFTLIHIFEYLKWSSTLTFMYSVYLYAFLNCCTIFHFNFLIPKKQSSAILQDNKDSSWVKR